jgi:hypothetical protein
LQNLALDVKLTDERLTLVTQLSNLKLREIYMNKFLLALVTALFFVGCATTSGSLPEIAPYDEPTYEPLPDMVPAE